jgi:hypothetical protein
MKVKGVLNTKFGGNMCEGITTGEKGKFVPVLN